MAEAPGGETLVFHLKEVAVPVLSPDLHHHGTLDKAIAAGNGQAALQAKLLSRGLDDFRIDQLNHLVILIDNHLSLIHISLRVERKQVSKLDGTIKYLWRLEDDNCVETVLMRYKHGNTVCVSSEIGCAMGCAFCASTIGGLVRRLTPAEILSQVIFTQKDSGLPISNIVLMGIGEPLDNFDNVMRFLELVNHPDGMNIGMRHIDVYKRQRLY